MLSSKYPKDQEWQILYFYLTFHAMVKLSCLTILQYHNPPEHSKYIYSLGMQFIRTYLHNLFSKIYCFSLVKSFFLSEGLSHFFIMLYISFNILWNSLAHDLLIYLLSVISLHKCVMTIKQFSQFNQSINYLSFFLPIVPIHLLFFFCTSCATFTEVSFFSLWPKSIELTKS